MLDVIWLIPALPLAGFLLLLVFGRRLGEPLAGWVATFFCTASFVATVGVFIALLQRSEEDREVVQRAWTWFQVGGLDVGFGFLADPLSITMALFVTGIAALIHLYSIGYMHGDPKFSKFFLYLNLFVLAMLVLVLGDNLVMTFLGWEGVGLASYLLISFWHRDMSNSVAGKKAFVTNRVGDFGFMLAMFLTFQAIGSLDYLELTERASELSQSTAAAMALLFFLGACGKSAQLPLSVWLPDAMAGPTPVSALIHAATMVTAGVFLMCRLAPVLHEVTWVGTVIAVVGLVTALWAATTAIGQNDIKKVLAYSTVSQLGLMFLAVGTGGYVAAVFHMVTHAFFKALLFLGAGSVIHGMGGEQDMRNMGGLRKYLPITYWTYLIGFLALAGVPPLAGFWSKDEILLYAAEWSWLLWAGGAVVALLTAYYMTRQMYLVFFGEPRWRHDEAHEPEPAPLPVGAGVGPEAYGVHPHESPPVMTVPLVILAGLSIVGGVLNLPFDKDWAFLLKWLEPVVGEWEAHLHFSGEEKFLLAVVASVVALVGIGLGVLVYAKRRVRAVEPGLFEQGWYLDALYAKTTDTVGHDAFAGAAWADAHLVDGAVEGVGTIVREVGSGERKLQTGYVRNYALGIVIGAVVLVGWFVLQGVM